MQDEAVRSVVCRPFQRSPSEAPGVAASAKDQAILRQQDDEASGTLNVHWPRCKSLAGAAFALSLGWGVAACAYPGRLDPAPEAAASKGAFHGIANARFYGDKDAALMAAEGVRALEREQAYLRRSGHPGPLPTANYLALSGGGDDGAFGAGVLVGWTAHGTRPNFKLVTGISTGALGAPFAFLGPEYDAALAEVYTKTTQADVFTKRLIIAAVTDDALTDTAPLYQTISRYLDDRMLRRIGQEYDKGRLLLIATTDLDLGKPVIWNIGAIAKSGDPNSLELVKNILVASASIPGVFPPVMFDVQADGQSFQEMHVDGGATAQAFLYPPTVMVRRIGGLQRRRVAYIIRNGRLSPPSETVQRQTLSIAKRAVATLIASNGVGDLYRMYATTKRDGVEFNLAYIDADFREDYAGPFDQTYMGKLFDYGRLQAQSGYRWRKGPPGIGGAS